MPQTQFFTLPSGYMMAVRQNDDATSTVTLILPYPFVGVKNPNGTTTIEVNERNYINIDMDADDAVKFAEAMQGENK